MESFDADRILKKAIIHFGPGTQAIKAMEEAGELVQALAKHFNATADGGDDDYLQTLDHVAEEMADVWIMIQQLEIMLNCHEQVYTWYFRKLGRLAARISEEEAENALSD